MYYSSTANDVPGTAVVEVERAVKPPWVLKTKVRNTSNTHSHEHTRPSTQPLTHPPTQQPTDAPTYPPTMCYSSTAECISSNSRCVADDTNQVEVTLGFLFFRLSATPGSERTLPREAPARRVVHRRPSFRRKIIGLLCGKGVEPPRGRGRPSGARESQVFFRYIITNIFKDPFGHDHHVHCLTALYNKDALR